MCICWGRCKKKAEIGPDGKKIAKLSLVERIFDNQINWFVGHKIIKWVVIAVSVAWYATSIWMTTQIKSLSKLDDMVDPNHPYMQTFTLLKEEF
jgi:predicted HNH restriction endonuclease